MSNENKDKTLFIKYYLNDTEYELPNVKKEDSISTIKTRVEKLLSIQLARVVVKRSKKPNPLVLDLTKTIHDYHIRSGDYIIVGRTEVHGGITIWINKMR
jgi:hypothetical protein